eukprot:scaffold217538_cov30-Tisochrysis_lutea.AAC.4
MAARENKIARAGDRAHRCAVRAPLPPLTSYGDAHIFRRSDWPSSGLAGSASLGLPPQITGGVDNGIHVRATIDRTNHQTEDTYGLVIARCYHNNWLRATACRCKGLGANS